MVENHPRQPKVFVADTCVARAVCCGHHWKVKYANLKMHNWLSDNCCMYLIQDRFQISPNTLFASTSPHHNDHHPHTALNYGGKKTRKVHWDFSHVAINAIKGIKWVFCSVPLLLLMDRKGCLGSLDL